ncbi:type I-B CRISPR-associated protein Cas7/Cst2/DevR [Paenibacillus sp. 481]|uniref:type I-B CRISPR-associated protein Cas7/Cst2/DevR n=1 Tax=Paenibacillus sp. 481 TaxID=2835869 RepID=UPI001E557E53|nr:type I-B CRISPR-associated protein Cas7/Cst2/DevR [Paenibacillus sp. 481]UHA72660.1 type I-B CRISPR-associated protein Cas7/Cst2/DevR [Paenibacillus sp. 481]
MPRALTFTAIFQAQSLNYGEGIGNISELKKFHRGNGDIHTFASRQSVRYDIVRMGNELFGWNLDTVDNSKGVVQFRKDVTIADSVEMDLFGYLKTDKESQKRPAVARLSHAIALEPYKGDMEFLNNMGLAQRGNGNESKMSTSLANIEQHHSYYSYTMTIDLQRVGIDGNVELSAQDRFERVAQLLEILKVLYRDIRGRRENLSPLFIVGGTYEVSNPFFLGRVGLIKSGKEFGIDSRQIKSVMDTTFMGESIGAQTSVGLVDGIWANEPELRDTFGEQICSVDQFFEKVKQSVQAVYGA